MSDRFPTEAPHPLHRRWAILRRVARRRAALRRVLPAGRGGERGAAAVEAALVFPLLLLLLFGILEVALLVNDNLLISQAARSAARTAVAMPRTVGYDEQAATSAAGVLGADTSGDIEQLTIYRADPATGRLVGGGDLAGCFTNCVRFTWDDASGSFRKVPGTAWPSDSQLACGGRDATDFVGVEIRGRHEWATGLFGDGVQLVERAVMRLEPVLGGSCGRSL